MQITALFFCQMKDLPGNKKEPTIEKISVSFHESAPCYTS